MAQANDNSRKGSRRRRRGFEAASSLLAERVQKAAEGRGFAVSRLLTHWPEIAGDKLIERIKEIVEEGNVRSLRLKASDGDIVLETPLTIGVVAGGAVALAAPWLAVLGVVAALVTHVTVEVVREVDMDKGDSSGS